MIEQRIVRDGQGRGCGGVGRNRRPKEGGRQVGVVAGQIGHRPFGIVSGADVVGVGGVVTHCHRRIGREVVVVAGEDPRQVADVILGIGGNAIA